VLAMNAAHNALSNRRWENAVPLGAAQLADLVPYFSGCAACGFKTTPIATISKPGETMFFPARIGGGESVQLWFKGGVGQSAYGVVSVLSTC